jgi:mRNA interferase MazF
LTAELPRGTVVIVSVPGDFGKPRPAVIVQHSRLTPIMESVVIALVTTSVRGGRHVRVKVEPTERNGLRATSRIMVDKLFAIQKHRISQVVGQLDGATMLRVDEALRTILALEPDLDLIES